MKNEKWNESLMKVIWHNMFMLFVFERINLVNKQDVV